MNKFREKIRDLREFLRGNETKPKLIKDGLASLIINGGNRVLVILTGILLVRILGKSQYGIYSYVLALLHVLLIPAECGISNLIVRETSQRMSRHEPSVVRGVWFWSLRISILISIGYLFLSSLVIIFGRDYFGQLEINTLFWAVVSLPFQTLIYISSAALRGLKKVIVGQFANMIIIPGLFATLLLVFNFLDSLTMTAATTMALRFSATIVAFLFSFVFLFLKSPSIIWRSNSLNYGKIWFSSVFHLGLSSGLNMLKIRSNPLIMGLFVNSSQIGVFQVAVSAAGLSGLVLQATNTILAPQFASLIANNDKRKLQKLVRINSLVVSVFNLIMTLIFVIFGKTLLAFAFGPGLEEAYPSLLILLLGQLVNSFNASVAYLLNMAGYEKDVMKVNGISILVSTILTLIITPIWGIIGGAIASSATLIISQIVMYKLVHNKLGIVSHMFGRIN